MIAVFLELGNKYDITCYLNGDNFDTQEEYDKRCDALEMVNDLYGNNPLVFSRYKAKEFGDCDTCIMYRLFDCAACALEDGYDCFTTSLTVSPHKNTALVNRLGQEVAAEVGVPFIEMDLKANGGFQRTVQISKQLGLYRQNYCGCKKFKQ